MNLHSSNMTKSGIFILCLLIGCIQSVELHNLLSNFLNPCFEDLGCFSTGPPFFNLLLRPMSLPPENGDVHFRLYTRETGEDCYKLQNTRQSLRASSFKANRPSLLYIHGFMWQFDAHGHHLMQTRDALLEVADYNFIVVDWCTLNQHFYPQAVANTRVVGAKIARFLKFLVMETGLDLKTVHLVGHSLGSQVAGYAGARIREDRQVGTLGRITGLDPAGPFYQDMDEEVRLDPSDADFVDVIHTNHLIPTSSPLKFLKIQKFGMGIETASGHMDFYPNGGKEQVDCPPTTNDMDFYSRFFTATPGSDPGAANGTVKGTVFDTSQMCAHLRVEHLFRESIKNSNCRFNAVQCGSYEEYQRGGCRSGRVAEMGFHAKKLERLSKPAKFYLKTNGPISTRTPNIYCRESQ